MPNHQYNPHAIEPKWQAAWDDQQAFRTSTDPAVLKAKPKYYILDMFPYPSGAGLHVGHPEGYTATDVLARLKRMQGFNVLHPMGWDAFGLPAERAAVREHRHPAEITKENIDNFRRQIKRLGFSYDWSREVNTATPEYYQWTQWIFLKLYAQGLAYMAEVPVNWCPAMGTVLANEEVKDGRYVETGDPVERRLMKQWMLRITAFAERLLADLDDVDWPEGVKEMQRNWIGRSEGIDITYPVKDTEETIACFTTRPDTNFGATFLSLAPEHPFVAKIVAGTMASTHRQGVAAYVKQSLGKSAVERLEDRTKKSGVPTGFVAINHLNGREMPIWVSDFVLADVGTGAVVGVPGHDIRDFAFARTVDLPIIRVVIGADGDTSEITTPEQVQEDAGTMINSAFLDGLDIMAAKEKIKDHFEAQGWGQRVVTYRLRDWLFSRQRYWGEPFPIVHCDDGEIVPLPASALPIELPLVDEYRPTDDGQPPLARADDAWSRVTLPDGRTGRLETNTMPQWAGSCWYYLRYLDPHNTEAAWSKDVEAYWMPVDLYVGGVEHAVLHLLYARFWHKVLYDCGLVHTKEPFQRLFNQGMILAYSYKDRRGKYHAPGDVIEQDGKHVLQATGEPVETQIEKMSKSKLNVVNPDDVIDQYGADAMRLYELFMGPLDQTKPWQMDGVEGVARFLARVWRMVIDDRSGALASKLTDASGTSEGALWRLLHQTIKKVLHDTEAMQFNTAIAHMMVFVNGATKAKTLPRAIVTTFVRLLAPYAPHLAEELWAQLGGEGLVACADVPAFDDALCQEATMTIVVQVNGKLRDNIHVDPTTPEDEIMAAALTDKVKAHMEGKQVVKTIYVPKRLVNIVVK